MRIKLTVAEFHELFGGALAGPSAPGSTPSPSPAPRFATDRPFSSATGPTSVPVYAPTGGVVASAAGTSSPVPVAFAGSEVLAAPKLGGPAEWHEHRGAESQQVAFSPSVELPLPADRGHELHSIFAANYSNDRHAAAWATFSEVVTAWLEGWKQTETVELEGEEAERDEDGKIILVAPRSPWAKMKKITYKKEVPVEQPDRENLLRRLGSGPVPGPLMQRAQRVGGLQVLVWNALTEAGILSPETPRRDRLDFVQEVAGSMVQVGIMVFPDLRVVLDETTRWEDLV